MLATQFVAIALGEGPRMLNGAGKQG